jgi:hypothetical protein
VSLLVCALRHVPFVLGSQEFNFALLEVFYVVNILIFGGLFWKFGSILSDVPNI